MNFTPRRMSFTLKWMSYEIKLYHFTAKRMSFTVKGMHFMAKRMSFEVKQEINELKRMRVTPVFNRNKASFPHHEMKKYSVVLYHK